LQGLRIVGASAAWQAALLQLQRVAESDAPVLIDGETGSGKELAARAVHYGGARHAGPFVPVNCGALPETLIESELFGVERGAFTDARERRRGLVAEATGGSLFLDEIDALSSKAQVALLRFLQDQRYRPLGGVREARGDVRVIAAANRSLQDLVVAGSFRADLLYRLMILQVRMPPLRERGADIDVLADHFVACLAAKYDRPPLPLHPATRAWLHQHSWPGNVRELENWLHRRFLMCSGEYLTHDTQLAAGSAATADPTGPLAGFAAAKAEAVRRFERDYLKRALDEAGGNVTRAARLAGKERRAFGKLLKKHGLACAGLEVGPP
jgi:DNA-binding NtrC family response regulator